MSLSFILSLDYVPTCYLLTLSIMWSVGCLPVFNWLYLSFIWLIGLVAHVIGWGVRLTWVAGCFFHFIAHLFLAFDWSFIRQWFIFFHLDNVLVHEKGKRLLRVEYDFRINDSIMALKCHSVQLVTYTLPSGIDTPPNNLFVKNVYQDILIEPPSHINFEPKLDCPTQTQNLHY